MFGMRDETKELKTALQAAGCDMQFIKNWQRALDRMVKERPAVQERYAAARESLLRVHTMTRRMEELLQVRRELTSEELSELTSTLSELKRLQGRFYHEFLVSREDREYSSTYETILRLLQQFVRKQENRLILQSEVENLMALSKENLDRREPDFWKLAFFYQKYDPRDLEGLAPMRRLDRVDEVYEEEFSDPMHRQIRNAITYAAQRVRELETDSSRTASKERQLLAMLLSNDGDSEEKQVEAIWLQLYVG